MGHLLRPIALTPNNNNYPVSCWIGNDLINLLFEQRSKSGVDREPSYFLFNPNIQWGWDLDSLIPLRTFTKNGKFREPRIWKDTFSYACNNAWRIILSPWRESSWQININITIHQCQTWHNIMSVFCNTLCELLYIVVFKQGCSPDDNLETKQ